MPKENRLKAYIDRFGMHDHYAAFMQYADSFTTGCPDADMPLALKEEHSCNVFCFACELAGTELAFASSDTARALALSGLYHDLGRFSQYTRYRTFDDKSSENHARLGVLEVKRRGFLKGEKRNIRNLALSAVLFHNRFCLPPGLSGEVLAVARAVRDADKLDIMRIMAAHLVTDDTVDNIVGLGVTMSSEVSPEILEAVSERRMGSYAAMRTTTDFKLLVCGWLYDLNFAFSRQTAVSQGHLLALAESLPASLDGFKYSYLQDITANAA